MSRNMSFLMTLATGVVLASASPGAGGGLPQAKPEAAQTKAAGPGEDAQGKSGETKAKAEAEEPQTQAEQAPSQPGGDGKLTSTPGSKALGMSILANQEAPTSLVIVPWKTSELGNSLGISTMLDDSRQPVDKDVFMRALRYYEIRSGTTDGAAGGRDGAAAASDATQSTAARRR